MANLTIKDISRIAGVGVSTISRVLNNHPDVKDETRKKVLEVIEEVNYIPNNSARNLKRNTSKSIGVLVKGINNPFFSKMIKSIEEKIDDKKYSMILHYNESSTDDFDAAIELIKEKKLKGLICLGGNFDNLDKKQMDNLSVPIVIASSNITSDANKNLFSSVVIENEKAAFDAVEYICKLGHKGIGIITTGEEDRSVGRLRFQGYKNAIFENGIKFDENLVEIGEYTFESGYEAMSRLLDKDLKITAVFVTTDIMAIGAAKAILSRGLKIPEDISIVGFDGIDYSKYFHPSLTTVEQPVENMAEKSIEILLNLINDKKINQHIVFKTKLLKRESCRKYIGG
ncbi:LacI family DNA-binding transcriptional regulator [Clostridium botulinum]|uniref:LacI family transcriptional regulator n=1 Tax=Clostridium botulinum C/D str. DC5 TaxID=1443128 RepID=A0A0A0IJV5_CLOBO|nr:LacI family DNA-binding transcriptional regulator [Clostridium botulinum]KGN00572.1 LacI family transcriptional regulator [Clostridium botulinum C/D str. DC5]KOC53656.1 LacI family transcriptional regulator [Clostridium botulinum]KOC55152.1 LacI family transcriptional regulator [Clostridium botulinum]MCD3233939.1 LacI family transcriptional regulator [Clostridium botulinum D/C]MCD3239777.1 LacI family transcriptional regulator [Clostridium botulinum D/C]